VEAAQVIGQILLQVEQLVLAVAALELQVLASMDRLQLNQDHQTVI
jgi:hypothetical protein